MRPLWLVIVLSWLLFSPLPAVAECGEAEFTVGLPEKWCCPNRAAQIACWAALGKPGGEEICHSLGCFRDHIDRIKKEKEWKNRREQKPSDCKDCQRYENGVCRECHEIGLHCLDQRCVTDEEYKRISEEKVRGLFVERKERERLNKEQSDNKIEQENFNRRHPEQPQKQPDTYLPPPIHPTDIPNKEREKLVVKPCGNGIWSCGVCCCPNQTRCNSLPSRLHPRGYGRLPSPDTLWDECRSYGCWPPPHEYQ